MAYQSGGSVERVPTQNGCNEEYKLYVNNIPDELNRDGIEQIFNHYGDIIALFYRREASWAYVTYGTYKEAESAVKDLNNVPPLNMTVTFAKERRSNPVPLGKPPLSEQIRAAVQSDNGLTHIDRSHVHVREHMQPLDVLKNAMSRTESKVREYTRDDELLYPYPSDSETYNPYENADPYASTNALWARGPITVTRDGKRHVSLGRGYTLYEIPHLDQNEIQDQVNKVYEKRSSGLYQYGEDVLHNTIGKCQKCLKVTKLTCERCSGFYCSRSCQISDWPRHRAECHAIPGLVASMNSMSVYETANAACESPIASTSVMPLRRPKIGTKLSVSTDRKPKEAIDPATRITNDSSECNGSKQPIINAINQKDGAQEPSAHNTLNINIPSRKPRIPNKSNSAETAVTQSNIFESIATNETKTMMKQDVMNDSCKMASTSLEKEKQNAKSPQSCYGNFGKSADDKISSGAKVESSHKLHNFKGVDVTQIEEDIAFQKRIFLSKTKFTDVRIILKASVREYWVQKIENDDDLTELMTQLQNAAFEAPRVSPEPGNIYAVQYENVWHRAQVTSLNPLTVHYIDYGNDEIVELNDFREIDKYKNIPNYSIKIRISEKTGKKYENLKYEDVLSVKVISMDSNNVLNVEVQGENEISISQTNKTNHTPIETKIETVSKTTTNVAPTSIQLKNAIDTVTVGSTGILEVHAELSHNTHAITLVPSELVDDFEKLLSDLPVECMQLPKNCSYRPAVGDLVCGLRADDDWLRGYIYSLEPSKKMAIIDEARIATVSEFVPCPEQFKKIFAFGATCTLTDAKHKLTVSQYEFTVIRCKDAEGRKEIEAEISADTDKLRVTIKPWVPQPEQKGIQFAELKNGDEVCITAYRNGNILYVRRLNEQETERYSSTIQRVAKCAQTASPLKEPPVIGQMVISHYTDDNYYRAIVTKVEGSKVAISYVDFGNSEVTNTSKLKILSDDLKQLQSCVAKVVLKDVPQNTAMTKDVNLLLSYYVGKEIPLICTFDGIPSKDGVYLSSTTAVGAKVNDKINELLLPTWKKNEKDTTCYTCNDMSVEKLGAVGDIVNALVLHISPNDKCTLILCPLDQDLITHVLTTMTESMTKYCESAEYYIPRERELCIVLHEGTWYRAICISRVETPTSSTVLLVDFGDEVTVDHKNMRAMTKDFMAPNALGSVCTIINLTSTDSSGKLSPEIENRVSELISPSQHLKVKLVTCDHASGLYNIEVPEVRATLIKEGLIS